MKEGIAMGFKDIFNKGMEMVNKGVESAKSAYEEKKQAQQEFELLKTRSNHIGPFSPLVVNNPEPQVGREQSILNMCLTINVENSKIVNKTIPIDETILDVKTGKEAKTEMEYAFIITDKKLWIMNKNEYMILDFESMQNFEIINKGLMSQSIKFNNNAFILDGKEADILRFGRILLDSQFRIEVEARSKAYLCEVVPVKQLINMNFKGVTFGANGELVLHNYPDNKKVDINEVVSVQLLINDTVCLMRGKNDSGSITSSPMEARKMSVKFILGMGEYVIETMPQSMMNATHKREDTVYRSNYEFSKLIVETVSEYMKNSFNSVNNNDSTTILSSNQNNLDVKNNLSSSIMQKPTNTSSMDVFRKINEVTESENDNQDIETFIQ